MKTITIKLVVDSGDEDAVSKDVQHFLEQAGQPVFCWQTRESNKTETRWVERQRKGEG